jgi:hypothetical protein
LNLAFLGLKAQGSGLKTFYGLLYKNLSFYFNWLTQNKFVMIKFDSDQNLVPFKDYS